MANEQPEESIGDKLLNDIIERRSEHVKRLVDSNDSKGLQVFLDSFRGSLSVEFVLTAIRNDPTLPSKILNLLP